MLRDDVPLPHLPLQACCPQQLAPHPSFTCRAGDPLTFADGTPCDVAQLVEKRNGFPVMHGEKSYLQMIAHFEEYNDVAGDSPLNLCHTSQVLNRFMLDIDDSDVAYDHVVGYLDRWLDDAASNGGVLPSNVGLDGTIGGSCDGKWWGGVYGWGFNCEVPPPSPPGLDFVLLLQQIHMVVVLSGAGG